MGVVAVATTPFIGVQAMNLSEYQQRAKQTAIYENREYPFLALSEEVGEVSGKLAKFVRKNQVSVGDAIGYASVSLGVNGKKLQEDLKAELGDVLWQLSQCATELGLTLDEVAEYNLAKLEDRSNRGVLEGSGDER